MAYLRFAFILVINCILSNNYFNAILGYFGIHEIKLCIYLKGRQIKLKDLVYKYDELGPFTSTSKKDLDKHKKLPTMFAFFVCFRADKGGDFRKFSNFRLCQ